tara:strand:+ start:2275 stop:2808 length:534 start_codon:yes stop_codon:yes gene_type:complete
MDLDTYFKITLFVIVSIIITIFILLKITKINKFLGRPIWHEPINIIDYNLDAPGTSKQILDIYSLSHITHGILFYFVFKYLKMPIKRAFILAIILEIIWEIFENTPYVINKYRERPEYINYQGDSIVNMIGDLFSMIVGFYLSFKNQNMAIMYLVITELGLIPFGANFLYLSFGSLL